MNVNTVNEQVALPSLVHAAHACSLVAYSCYTGVCWLNGAVSPSVCGDVSVT